MAGRAKLILQAAALMVVALLLALLAWQVADANEGRQIAAAVEAGRSPVPPDIELERLDGGGTVSLSDFAGKAVVLNFWASWCGPCKEEAPLLQRAWERYEDEGLVVLGIDAQDFRVDARRFVERYGLTYPIVHDGSGSSLGRFGVTGFPETWFVGRSGKLVGERIQGAFTEEQLERNIELALRS